MGWLSGVRREEIWKAAYSNGMKVPFTGAAEKGHTHRPKDWETRIWFCVGFPVLLVSLPGRKASAGLSPTLRPGGQSVFWSFLPTFLGSLPSTLKDRHLASLWALQGGHSSLSARSQESFSALKDSWSDWAHVDNPGSFCIPRPLALITSEKSLVRCTVTCSQVLGIRTWTSLGREGPVFIHPASWCVSCCRIRTAFQAFGAVRGVTPRCSSVSAAPPRCGGGSALDALGPAFLNINNTSEGQESLAPQVECHPFFGARLMGCQKPSWIPSCAPVLPTGHTCLRTRWGFAAAVALPFRSFCCSYPCNSFCMLAWHSVGLF